jgi:NAD-dependent aldehyde dehydrogenases
MTKLKEYKMYINGTWVDAENKKTFKSLNPENNEPWAIVPEASTKEVNKAVESAQKAFEGKWSKLMPRERANYLKAIANQLRENPEMLGKIETMDTGKLRRETKTQANDMAEYNDNNAG